MVLTATNKLIIGAGSAAPTHYELAEAKVALALDGSGNLVAAVDRTLERITADGRKPFGTLPEVPHYTQFDPSTGQLIAAMPTYVARVDSSDTMISLPIGEISVVSVVEGGQRAIVLTQVGNVLLVDFEKERSEPLVSRVPRIENIASDNRERFAVVRAGGRIELHSFADAGGRGKFFGQVHAATNATIDTRTEELVWP